MIPSYNLVVLIVCKKITRSYLDFPPVLVVEVLSPATASKDRGEKMELYQSEKVKYYLIVDAHFKKIEVYELQENGYGPPFLHPVSFHFIFNENCSTIINFSQVWDE